MWIKRVVIKKIHGYQDISVSFNPDLSIIHGVNGTGKTTLLHTIVNILERDFERFIDIYFDEIFMEMGSGSTIQLIQEKYENSRITFLKVLGIERIPVTLGSSSEWINNEILDEILGGYPVYLPAFRSILEGIGRRRYGYVRDSSIPEEKVNEVLKTESLKNKKRSQFSPRFERDAFEQTSFKTIHCRNWFGEFVPTIRYPSLEEIEGGLQRELNIAQSIMAEEDQQLIYRLLGGVIDVVASGESDTGEDPAKLLVEIESLTKYIENSNLSIQSILNKLGSLINPNLFSKPESSKTIGKILKVYRDALNDRNFKKKSVYNTLEEFRESINRFLFLKELSYDDFRSLRPRTIHINIPNGAKRRINILSSGERHVLSLIYSASHMLKSDSVLIIDEPELSLHVDWQRMILTELLRHAQGRQIITCTHAPEIAGEHLNKFREIHTRSSEDPKDDDSINEIPGAEL